MEAYLAPAVMVALAGLILQGVKAAIDLWQQAAAQKAVNRQRNIALYVAISQLIDASAATSGECLEAKRRLANLVLRDVLTHQILVLLNLQPEPGITPPDDMNL